MKSAILATSLAVVAASAASLNEIMAQRPALNQYDNYTYDDFIAEFKRDFHSTNEYSIRKAIFDSNLLKIKEHNSKNLSWWMAVTPFADLTQQEFVGRLGRVKPEKGTIEQLQANPINVARSMKNSQISNETKASLPVSVDNSRYMTQIRNQGRCGSCWAQAAAGALEAQTAIKTGKNFRFSTQQLVSCVDDPQHCGGTGGCHGSTEAKAFEYLESIGGHITSEDVYPYTSGEGDSGVCKYTPSMPTEGKLLTYTMLAPNNQKNFITAVATPHVFTVSVAASSWALYGGGIYTGCTDKKDYVTNHAVIITGYDSGFYTIANSWGEKWGSGGYMHLRRTPGDGYDKETCGVNKEPWSGSACDGDTTPVVVCGECGILSESTLAFVA